jgi:hypothetical protein
MTATCRRTILAVLVLVLAGVSVLAPSPAFTQVQASGASEKPTVLVNITQGKDELHAVSMAIGLASDAIKTGRRAGRTWITQYISAPSRAPSGRKYILAIRIYPALDRWRPV